MLSKVFFIKQKQQLSELGLFYYIVRKLPFCHNYFIVLLLFPAYIFIRLIRPIKLIRFGSLHDNVIGHFAGNNEAYLCEKENGFQPSNSLDIFYSSRNICNKQLLKMWKRVLNVNPIAYYFDKLNDMFLGGHLHKITTANSDRDINGLLEKSKIHLFFTDFEKAEAKKRIQSIGIDSDIPFVCIVARDNAFKKKVNLKRDWSYHDYRDSDINNYLFASESLTHKGYYVIRMGFIVNKPLITSNPKIIDYSNSGYRSELLDIFLPATCKFIIVGESGLGGISRIFRVPCVFVNFCAIEYLLSWDPRIIMIPKKYWLKKEKKFLTFKEIFSSGVGRFLRTDQYEKMNIELIENTPDEILDVSFEMHKRLNSRWKSSEEDETLQKRFWKLLPKSELHGEIQARIGASFLRQNQDLLN